MLTHRTGEYWIINQILAKGLHNTDQECLAYTTTLMDKLEQVSQRDFFHKPACLRYGTAL